MTEMRKLLGMGEKDGKKANENVIRHEITEALDEIFDANPAIYSTEEIVLEILKKLIQTR